jgi:hypothetical protein
VPDFCISLAILIVSLSKLSKKTYWASFWVRQDSTLPFSSLGFVPSSVLPSGHFITVVLRFMDHRAFVRSLLLCVDRWAFTTFFMGRLLMILRSCTLDGLQSRSHRNRLESLIPDRYWGCFWELSAVGMWEMVFILF